MKSAKLVALGLAAAMTASLAACGASSTPAAGSSSGKAGGNVIRIGVFEPTTGENGGGEQNLFGRGGDMDVGERREHPGQSDTPEDAWNPEMRVAGE